MAIRYRLSRLQDAPLLAEMRWEFMAEDGEPAAETRTEFRERFLAFYREGLESGRWTFWVAEDDHLIAHMAVLTVQSVPRPSRSGERWGYLTNCFTVPAHRGRGVGAELLRHVQSWASEQDLELLIVSPSDAARPFYARAGFGVDTEFLLCALDEAATHLATELSANRAAEE